MERPNYYGILPAVVRYDENLKPSEKVLFTELTALTQKEGYCFASNAYFAALYNVAVGTISLWLNSLQRQGHIKLIIEQNYRRKIYTLQEKLKGDTGKAEAPPSGKAEENTTRINTKKKYADYVSMTEKEFDKLVDKYGKSQTATMIDKLNSYKGSKGKRYKSDYMAILTWVVDAVGAGARGVQTDSETKGILDELKKRREGGSDDRPVV